MINSSKRNLLGFAFLLLLLGGACFLTLYRGPVEFSIRDFCSAFFYKDGFLAPIIWELRIPRIIAAILSGAALSIAGLSLQTIFRNPLCGPFVLGISSGANFGVALVLLAGVSLGNFGLLSAASLGSFFVILLILFMASKFENSATLLIAGLLIGYFIDALVSLLIASAPSEALKSYMLWGMGSFGYLTLEKVPLFIAAFCVGIFCILLGIKYLNAARLGDDFARGLGIAVKQKKCIVLLGTSLLAGIVTGFCGPIAFIGVAVPHLAFLLFKTSNHRILIPASALCGADLALIAGQFQTLPLNGILSFIGVPIILWVLLKKGRIA